MLHSVN